MESLPDVMNHDPIIEEQKYILLSFIEVDKPKNIKILKFRGAFPTIEKAKDYAATLSKKDPQVNIFLGEGFKWVEFNPDVSKIKDVVFQEKELNEILNNYQENCKLQSEIEMEKRRAVMAEAQEKTKQAVRERIEKEADHNNVSFMAHNTEELKNKSELQILREEFEKLKALEEAKKAQADT